MTWVDWSWFISSGLLMAITIFDIVHRRRSLKRLAEIRKESDEAMERLFANTVFLRKP